MLSTPTRHRRVLRRLAVRSYKAQTYPHRVLVLAGDMAMDDERDICVVDIQDGTIGARRNAAIEQIAADWIAHWDDDDWSAPDRIETMLALAREADKPAVALRSMWFDDGSTAWRYRGSQPWHICGTSLLYRRSVWEELRFSDTQIGEDTEFSRQLHVRGWLLSVDDHPHLMVARDHGGNTSQRDHAALQWTAHRRDRLPQQYLEDAQRCGGEADRVR